MSRLSISPIALQDLQDIKKYITEELCNPSSAIKIIANITKRMRSLNDNPFMGASLSSIINIDTDYRYLICGKYLVFYRVKKEVIYIDRVLYGARDFVKILFGDLREE